MKSLCLISFLLFAGTAFAQQKKAPQTTNRHTSQNSIDWAGTYRGVLPCADCEGIETTITLNKDLTYRTIILYIGKSDSVIEHSGKFSWKDGNTIMLEFEEESLLYNVGENTLTQLDVEGKPINGISSRYVLSKSTNSALLEKYWMLVELDGKAVKPGSYRRMPHLIFKTHNSGVAGSGGCNRISGTYKLKSGNSISFSRMISTRMACVDMEADALEARFLKMLQVVDNYNVVGDKLILNQARKAPLAKFKAAHME